LEVLAVKVIASSPLFLMHYYEYVHPIFTDAGIDMDAAFPGLELHLVRPQDMPEGGANSHRPHYNPGTNRIYIPVVDLIDVPKSTKWHAKRGLIGHETGHAVHTLHMPANSKACPKWQKFGAISGSPLDFSWREKNVAGKPYPYVLAFEEFADEFSYWLNGRRPGQKYSEFYFSLWGQEVPEEKGEIAEEMKKIEMWIDSKSYRIDGQERVMDTAPVIIGNRTMVPVRFIAEALGMRVDWDDGERKVTISR